MAQQENLKTSLWHRQRHLSYTHSHVESTFEEKNNTSSNI